MPIAKSMRGNASGVTLSVTTQLTSDSASWLVASMSSSTRPMPLGDHSCRSSSCAAWRIGPSDISIANARMPPM